MGVGQSAESTLSQIASILGQISGSIGGGDALLIAASDSPSQFRSRANYLCDGAADNVEIQEAIDALTAFGGTITLAPGTYQIATSPIITDESLILISGFGATLVPATNQTALTINQGVSSTVRGAVVAGIRFDPGANTGTTGILVRDSNNASIMLCEFDSLTVGIQLNSHATNSFVEGSWIVNCLMRQCDTGIDMLTDGGTGSFGQTRIEGLKCVVGGSSVRTGVNIGSGCIFYRSFLIGTFWTDNSSEIGVNLAGDVKMSHIDVGVEGASGTGVNIASTIANENTMFLRIKPEGALTSLVNGSSKSFHLQLDSMPFNFIQTSGTVFGRYRRFGDTTDRIRFEGLTAGGRIQFGSGSALDVNLYRDSGAILATDQIFAAKQRLRLPGVISPTQLSGNTDNWNPTNLATAGIIRIDASTPINLTGIVAQTAGDLIMLTNISANTITLVHNATSTAANQFLCPGSANFSLTANKTVWIWYDTTSSRWRVIG